MLKLRTSMQPLPRWLLWLCGEPNTCPACPQQSPQPGWGAAALPRADRWHRRYSMDYMKRLRGEPQCHEEPRIEGVSRRLLQDPNDRGLGPGMDPRQQGQFGGRGGGRGGPMGGPGGDDRWAKGRGAPMPGGRMAPAPGSAVCYAAWD